jgi:hypothetical protein
MIDSICIMQLVSPCEWPSLGGGGGNFVEKKKFNALQCSRPEKKLDFAW